MGYNLLEHLYEDFIEKDRYMYIVSGLGNTLLITVFALIIGVALGIITSMIKVTYNQGSRGPLMKVLNLIVGIYLTVIRGTPTVVQLLISYFIILQNVDNGIISAIIAFGINSGAYVSEVFRSGIQSVDKGQTEAGRSLGLSWSQTMRRIVLHQAVRNVAPAIFKDT